MLVPVRLENWFTSLTFGDVFLDKKCVFLKWGPIVVLLYNTQLLKHNASSSTLPCMVLRFVNRREWNGVFGQWTALSLKGSKSFSRALFRLCCCLFEDAHKPNIRCNNVWKPQTDLKTLAENAKTPDPHKLTRCCENGDGICYRCLLCW